MQFNQISMIQKTKRPGIFWTKSYKIGHCAADGTTALTYLSGMRPLICAQVSISCPRLCRNLVISYLNLSLCKFHFCYYLNIRGLLSAPKLQNFYWNAGKTPAGNHSEFFRNFSIIALPSATELIRIFLKTPNTVKQKQMAPPFVRNHKTNI